MSKVLELVGTHQDGAKLYRFYCPACGRDHHYTVGGTNPHNGPRWTFDGNMDKPTFGGAEGKGASLLIYKQAQSEDGKTWHRCGTECHLFVENGMIRYCGDCPHSFAGKTVPMEALT